MYVDNGAAYRSKHLEHITASLGIALIHAKPYQPQGKGKIERFNRRVRQQFSTLRSTALLNDLNERFDAWLRQEYSVTRHSAIGQTPMQRFVSRMECIRPAPDNLSDHFRAVARRRVAKAVRLP